MEYDSGRPDKKRFPLELLLATARVVSVVASYLLALRRRKRHGDKW